jgi:hypothetical protein
LSCKLLPNELYNFDNYTVLLTSKWPSCVVLNIRELYSFLGRSSSKFADDIQLIELGYKSQHKHWTPPCVAFFYLGIT